MITFDDGYKNTYQNAFPLMQKYGFPGIASIIISKMDESGYMTGGEIRGLQDNQWEIASHTWTHPLLTQTHITKISHEITASKIALESWFHQKINIFVYPG
jgi:peptidoglycan/xylan/chitin deacetylase (PgdA/CDA1 family)